jgi:hypothetical protein
LERRPEAYRVATTAMIRRRERIRGELPAVVVKPLIASRTTSRGASPMDRYLIA